MPPLLRLSVGEAKHNEDLDALLSRAVFDCLGAQIERTEPIPGQLGLRRFVRVWLRGMTPATLVARIDAPEDPAGRPAGIPPEPALEPLRAFLETAGLPVPARYGGDPDRGLDLLEDVGSVPLGAAIAADPGRRHALYAEACGLVPRLQRLRDPGGLAAFGRRLDAAHFAYKAELFATWSLAQRGREATPAEKDVVRRAFQRVAGISAQAPARLSHRDFQSANLYCVAGRPDGAGLVMIDLQGAFLAPPEYDLVCLLRDSYVELGDDELATQLERVRPLLPDAPDAESFARRFDLLTLTRKGKDHARFLYAAAERGDRRFQRFVPSTVRALHAAAQRAAARDPEFAPLAELVSSLPETACAE